MVVAYNVVKCLNQVCHIHVCGIYCVVKCLNQECITTHMHGCGMCMVKCIKYATPMGVAYTCMCGEVLKSSTVCYTCHTHGCGIFVVHVTNILDLNTSPHMYATPMDVA